MNIEELLQSLASTKTNIKQALIAKGLTPSDVFSSYPLLIEQIETGSDIDLSFITATSQQILENYVGADTNGNQVEGSITQRTSLDITVDKNIVTTPSGYYSEAVTKEVPAGTASKINNVVTITLGYQQASLILVGEALEVSTIIPGTSDITLSSDSYLTLDVTIKGDTNLVASNIKKGTTIFDVEGSLETATDLSFINATALTILEGYIGADSSGQPINGAIKTVTPNRSANVFTVGKGYVASATELIVPIMAEPTVEANVVTIPAGYNSAQQTVTIPKVSSTVEGAMVTIPEGYHEEAYQTVESGSIQETGEQIIITEGYISGTHTFDLGADVSGVTASQADVRSSVKFVTADGGLVSGTMTTVIPTVSENIFSIGTGYVEATQLTVPESTITETEEKVTIGVGYIAELKEYAIGSGTVDTEKVGVLVEGTDGTLMFQELTFDGTTPTDSGDPIAIEGTYLYNTGKDEPDYGGGESGGGTGTFDIVKVTEYSPYVPAYPAQVGYVFDLAMKTWDGEGNEVDWDASAYEGLYTVTEETKGCTGFGRVFTNANGKWLYAFSYENFGQASDENSTAVWCIYDSLGDAPESGAIVYSDTVSGGKLPSAITSWNGMMYMVSSVTVTEQTTSGATEAIPMVLNGTRAEDYDTSTKTWTDGSAASAYSSFEFTPNIDWYYACKGTGLFGAAIGSAVQPNLYVPLHEDTTVASTGQTVTKVGSPKFVTLDGVACADLQQGAAFNVAPVNFLTLGKHAFSLSAFIRIDKQESNHYCLFNAYKTDSNPYTGFIILLDGGYNFRIRGGNPNGGYSGFDPTITSYNFPREKWVHFCYVYFGGYEKVYINGSEIWDNDCERDFIAPTSSYATIGNNINPSGFWDGYISEFKYYPNAISPQQIKAEADRCLAMVTE